MSLIILLVIWYPAGMELMPDGASVSLVIVWTLTSSAGHKASVVITCAWAAPPPSLMLTGERSTLSPVVE